MNDWLADWPWSRKITTSSLLCCHRRAGSEIGHEMPAKIAWRREEMIKLMKTFELNGRRSQSVRDPESLFIRGKFNLKGRRNWCYSLAWRKKVRDGNVIHLYGWSQNSCSWRFISPTRKHIIVTKNDVVRFWWGNHGPFGGGTELIGNEINDQEVHSWIKHRNEGAGGSRALIGP